MRTDLAVFSKEFPEAVLIVEVKRGGLSKESLDSVVKQLSKGMWGARCHYGLLVTPTQTFVLRDDFEGHGPSAIHVTNTLPTEKLLGRVMSPGRDLRAEPELESAVRDWLERLAASYESALPEDPDVTNALFPEIVGAVAGGRVLTEAAV